MEGFFQLLFLFQIADVYVVEELIIANYQLCKDKLIKVLFIQTFRKH